MFTMEITNEIPQPSVIYDYLENNLFIVADCLFPHKPNQFTNIFPFQQYNDNIFAHTKLQKDDAIVKL